MTHSDDEGLVLPPKLAPIQVVIIPIPKPNGVLKEECAKIKAELEGLGISVKVDNDKKKRPGFKFAEYEMLGVPVRIGIGARDLEKNQVEVARRDTKEKMNLSRQGIGEQIKQLLVDIQDNLLARAKQAREDRTSIVNSMEEFEEVLESKGGFILAHWDGTTETELAIKEKTKATLRCIPLEGETEEGLCVFSGKKSIQRVLFAKAY